MASKSKWARIQRLQRDRAWLESYEAAKQSLRAGDTNVLFPYGSWKVRVYYGLPCEPPPQPARASLAA